MSIENHHRSGNLDAWIDGQTCAPKLMPENVVVPALSTMAQND